MTHRPNEIVVAPFGTAADVLRGLAPSLQRKYLCEYLTNLGTMRVIAERAYFDRDFLAEFSAYYGSSANAYPNICKRLHFFSDAAISREVLLRALDDDRESIAALQHSYLGFMVLRPIERTPFGRTVLAMYPHDPARARRVARPAREYTVHLAGLALKIEGIAWQQQDTAVSACATVAMWSMLQSSAFDEHHAIPTTADITRLANQAVGSIGRVFPSTGLSWLQLTHAIRAAGLEPVLVESTNTDAVTFSSVVASLIRSGFPVLVSGKRTSGMHAVCAVAFREGRRPAPGAGEVQLQDAAIEALYVHDDNVGPNARFGVSMSSTGDDAQPVSELRLRPQPPKNATAFDAEDISRLSITPAVAMAALPHGLRLGVVAAHRHGHAVATKILEHLNGLRKADEKLAIGFRMTVQFARVADYLAHILVTGIEPGAGHRARVRTAFVEIVPPTSLHVAVVRVGTSDVPLFDLVYDTSDSDPHIRPWCIVVFDRHFIALIDGMKGENSLDYEVLVDAS